MPYYKVLFLCTGNSARSIMAEAIMNRKGRGNFTAFSAGSHPTGAVRPEAIRQLEKAGLSTADVRSKSWDEFSKADSPHLSFVFTVCDNAANEVCPFWPGHPMMAHWGIPDPAAMTGTPEEIDRAFSQVFQALDRRTSLFLCLPFATIDTFVLQEKLNEIGKSSASMRFVIVGGSDAGISAALRARELSPDAEIAVLLEDDFPNYSICGLPFYLSGETPDWHSLAHRTVFDGIAVHRQHRATRIDPVAKAVTVEIDSNAQGSFSYDKLLIATGARPVQPHIDGWKLPGVFLLHTMKDSFRVHEYLERVKPRRAVIIGAGYIGLEMADALTHRGIEVTIASRTDAVLATVDSEFGKIVGEELQHHGVKVSASVEANRISQVGDHLLVSGSEGFEQDCEMVLIAVGVKPNAALGIAAGFKTGDKGALLTNRKMESGVSDVYVAGDCAETWHRLLNRHTYLPLGTTAHKQGRTAGENAAGGDREFAGSLGTQVVKIFNTVVARTGFRHDEAEREGYRPFTVESTINDHKAYYPGATALRARVTADLATGRLLGAQLMGTWGAEVSKRVDVFATALFHGMTVDEISDLDLSYTPPLSSPWDPVQMASQAWSLKSTEQLRGTECAK